MKKLSRIALTAFLVYCVLSTQGMAENSVPLLPGSDQFSNLILKKFSQRDVSNPFVESATYESWLGQSGPQRGLRIKRWVLGDSADLDWFVTTPQVMGSSKVFPGWDSENNGALIANLSGGTALLFKNRTLVRVSVNARLDEVGSSYMQSLLATVSSSLSDGSGGQDLDITLKGISGHVKPHKNEQVEILVSFSRPAISKVLIYRVSSTNKPGELVYSEAQARKSQYTFVWDGLKSDGTRVDNGNYDVVIESGGSLQKTSVQVNFQGK